MNADPGLINKHNDMDSARSLSVVILLIVSQFLLTDGVPVDPARRAVVSDVTVVNPPSTTVSTNIKASIPSMSDIMNGASKLYDMLPDMPKMPDISLPKMPEISLPKMPEISLPKMPEISLPKMPEISLPKMPEITMPDMPKLPNMDKAKEYVNSAVAAGKDAYRSAKDRASDAYHSASNAAANAYNSMPPVNGDTTVETKTTTVEVVAVA